MAVPKIVGIETEYGVALRGAPDPNPVIASSLLINGYVEQHRVGWDFEDESPGRDARGFARDGSQPPEVETHLVNAVLTNGARYYVDHAHPEYSTPECSDPMQAVLFDKAGERILARSMDAARQLLPAGQEIVVYKNNSDGKGNSYGCHENFLVDRAVPFAMLVRNLIPWFVTRQVFTGAGKVGSENGADAVDFQISQRADFFEEEVGLETTLKRPIVNTRDEPHADPQKYRRLHVIVGDANLCEVATFLKVGATAIVLAMIEDGFIDKDLSISGPVPAMRSVSHDPTCRATVDVASLGRCTAIEMQWEFLRLARKYADESGLEVVRRRRDRRPGARPLGARAHHARARPVGARRPARLGHEVEPDPCIRRPRQLELERSQARRSSTSSTTTCGRNGRSTSAWCGPARSSAWWPSPRCGPPWSTRPRPPGPISGAPASPAGPTPWSPPTGTVWCSTSAATRCEGSQ